MRDITKPVGPSTTAVYTDAIMRALEVAGVDPQLVMQDAQVERVRSNDPLLRIGDPQINAIFARAVALTGDPYFGLRVAQCIVPGTLHALGYALLASETLEDFCQRLARFWSLISTNAASTSTVCENELVFAAKPVNPELCYESHDTWAGMVMRLMRNARNAAISPKRLELIRPLPPEGAGPFLDYFGCPITFGCQSACFYFDLEVMRAPLPGASRELAQHHDQIARSYLEKLDRGDVVNRVRTHVVAGLGIGAFSRQEVADRLNMSASTLQVKLAQNGTSFQKILEDTRHELALGYMTQSRLSITEIAFMLGFSDLSNFIRAFKRWTGKSPTEFKREPPRTG
jgi:AraC-like DNA-binding protein